MKWYLDENRVLRFGSFAIFYIAQGLPIGLISIALPAWLAQQDVSASGIATFVSITSLPWGFKLLAGPIMDRFSFLPMGRRRPWVIAAQLGLLISMLSLTLVPDPVNNILLLTWVAFIINSFAAIQDVAVDGMAIDVLPDVERGRANSFMGFGQVAGYSASGAISAAAMISFGVAGAAIILTIGIAAIFVWAIVVRERRGEKLLPWTEGEKSERSLALQSENFLEIARNLTRVLILPASLLLIAVALMWRIASGFFLVGAPVIVVQDLGYSSTDYSYWSSVFGIIAAVSGLFIGPLIDRIGAKVIFAWALLGLAVTYFIAGFSVSLWSIAFFPLLILALDSLFGQAVFICFISIHMNVCWNKVSATQFSIYMAWSNLARSIGAYIYGELKPGLAQGEEFLIMGVSAVIGAALLLLVNINRHQDRLTQISDAEKNGVKNH